MPVPHPPTLSPDITVGDLPAHDFSVPPETSTGEVAWELQSNPLLPGVVLRQPDGALVGVITRAQFLRGLTTAATQEEYLATAIGAALRDVSTQCLKLAASARVDEAAKLVLNRESGAVTEPVLIEYPSGEHRLLDAFTLLRAQADLLGQANETIRLQQEATEIAYAHRAEFLANVSHEIRTPMNGILGMTSLALDTPLTDEQREYLQLVRTSGESLMRVINDILDFSKVQAGHLELDPVAFSLRDSISDAIRPLAARAHQASLDFDVLVHPDVPDRVVGDPSRLRQVLVNLINNALKFTSAGRVVLEVSVDALVDSDVLLRFVVSDTGIGIPREKQQVIFLPYVQADSSTTRQYGGTGLGLTISSRLVAAMGGRIWCESEPGAGSTFSFTARMRRSESPAERSFPHTGLDGTRVLIIDPSPTHRRILAATLKSWRLSPVGSAPEIALSDVRFAADRGDPFSLVLIDASSPSSEGPALAAAIAPDIPCIVMVPPAFDAGDRAKLTRAGVRALVTVPLKRAELLESIARVMQLPDPAALLTDPNLAPPPTPVAPPLRPLRILVAEDHPINQRLVTRMLEKQGHTVTLASNGLEALANLDGASFDVVLMDVQMPEMSGLEAAAELRKREVQTGRRTPVIAMTAHAMEEDRERCLAGGMDAYVSKPVTREGLNAALASVTSQSAPPTVAAPATEAVDADALLQRCASDPTLLAEVIELFLGEWPLTSAGLTAAVKARDASRVAQLSHRLRGAVGVFAFARAVEATQRLETLAETSTWSEIPAALRTLELAVGKLVSDLQSLARKVQVP
jgi:signal transduction histidine kinase/CheY-like chemotaxis protein/HPt (histidine-containing phosphotransfer) domain-containing protein